MEAVVERPHEVEFARPLEESVPEARGLSKVTQQQVQIGEVTQPGNKLFYFRPDGSLTHW